MSQCTYRRIFYLLVAIVVQKKIYILHLSDPLLLEPTSNLSCWYEFILGKLWGSALGLESSSLEILEAMAGPGGSSFPSHQTFSHWPCQPGALESLLVNHPCLD
jgi:hypothetical protein